MSYSSNQPSPLGPSSDELSPLAGPNERSAYEQLLALARAQTSPLSSETPGAPTSPANTPGASYGAPSTGNFGQDLAGFGRAAGQTALGMVANPASIPGSVIGTMAAAAVRGLTGQVNPVNVATAIGLRGLTNALGYAARGPTAVETAFGAQDGSKPSAMSQAEAAAQMANAAAMNDMGPSKASTMENWGTQVNTDSSGVGGSAAGGGMGGQSGGEQGGAGIGGGGGMSGVGGGTGGSSSGGQDSGGASGANLAGGGLIPFSEGGNIVTGPGGGLDDLIPTTINGRRAAALSDGEFVIPADVVSMMGDGSSNAGAKRLYDFMNTIRQHKTGTTDQAGPLPIGDILKRTLR